MVSPLRISRVSSYELLCLDEREWTRDWKWLAASRKSGWDCDLPLVVSRLPDDRYGGQVPVLAA